VPAGRPVYAAEKKIYQLADGQDQLVVDLKFSKDGVNYIKRFSLKRGLYDVNRQLPDRQPERQPGAATCLPSSSVMPADPSSSTATGTATYLGAALWTSSEPYKKVSMKDIDKGSLKENVTGGWVAWLQHYFVTAWIPAKGENNVVQTRKDSQATTSSVTPARR
jgi:YidC/Oxa1 family membrane protein insertase